MTTFFRAVLSGVVAVCICIGGVNIAFGAMAYTPKGYVNDYADIINDDAEQYIASTLTALDGEGRGQVAVVTVPSLDGDTVEGFAVTLFNEWGIGDAEKDDGVLLLIAPNERELRIEVGYGMEGVLTDLESSWIIRDSITPKFREGDMSGGVVAGVESIARAIREEIPESETRDPAFYDDGTGEGPFPNAPKTTAGKLAALFVPLVIFSFFLGTSIKNIGGIVGTALAVFFGLLMNSWVHGAIAALLFAPLGSAISRFAFRYFPGAVKKYPFLMGDGGSGFGSSSSSSSSSSSGGFGGGSSGGGGASGRW